MSNELGSSVVEPQMSASPGRSIAPLAVLSVFVGAMAIGAVIVAPLIERTRLYAAASQDEVTADPFTRAAPRPAPVSLTITRGDEPTPPKVNEQPLPSSESIVPRGGAPAPMNRLFDNAGPSTLASFSLPIPRLKPASRAGDVPPEERVAPGIANPAAALETVAFTAPEDFTGGRERLFTEYAAARLRDRIEQRYATVVVPRGETLAQTLTSIGGSEADVAAALEAIASVMDGAEVSAGTAIDYAFDADERPTGFISSLDTTDADGRDATDMFPAEGLDNGAAEAADPQPGPALARIRFRPDTRNRVTAWRQADGTYAVHREELEVEKRFAAVAGVIQNSLFAAASRSEVPPEIMVRFANLFLYDIDFARDIYAGDRFEAVYEVFYTEDGSYVGTGDIVYAAMSWRGQREARGYYRYDGDTDVEMPYFDASGESANRLLMKTPIEGARVTSTFGARRHPILGYTKGHKGVDFGARTGTPVMAAGDGVIERAAMTGTFGNYVRIRHASGYKTAYAHLHGYAKGIKAGTKVRQGEIIGYVGSTGRSTGPHLHYEVHKGDEVLNPMTLAVAIGRSLPEDELLAFADQRSYVDTLRVRPFTVAAATLQ